MDDNILIEKIRAGDQESFRYLVDKYKDRSFTLAHSIVNDEMHAEEVIQDAFLHAYKGLGQFKMQSAFATWFYRIVVNESLKKIRKKKLEFTGYENPEADESDLLVSNDSMKLLQESEQQKYIQMALAGLKENERLVLQLHYLDELSHSEIQEITGLNLSNIKILLHRARKNFYTALHALLKHETRLLI